MDRNVLSHGGGQQSERGPTNRLALAGGALVGAGLLLSVATLFTVLYLDELRAPWVKDALWAAAALAISGLPVGLSAVIFGPNRKQALAGLALQLSMWCAAVVGIMRHP